MVIGTEQYLLKDYYSGFAAINCPIQTNQAASLTPINVITSSYNNSNMLSIQNGIVVKDDALLQISLYGKFTIPSTGYGSLVVLKNGAALKQSTIQDGVGGIRYASLTIVTKLKQGDVLSVGYTMQNTGGEWSEIQLSVVSLGPAINPIPAQNTRLLESEEVFVLSYNGDYE